jgi:phosphatidylserine synthase
MALWRGGSMWRRALPRWSGETLDLVVDFTTYVFVPAYAVAAGGLVPPAAAVPLAILIVTSGALYFADRRMKDRGQLFPRLPGGVERPVFYLFLRAPSHGLPPVRGAARGADLRAGSVRASVPRAALAR